MGDLQTRMARAEASSDDDSFLELEEAARLAHIQRRRLARWVDIGVVTPSRRIVSPSRDVLEQGFSLGDVGYLHLIQHLRDRGVPLHDAVKVLFHLIGRFGPPSDRWRDATIAVSGRRVVAFAPDEWQATLAVPGTEGAGQRLALEILGDLLPSNVSLESILIPSEFLPYIELSAKKENGLPVIRNTRLQTSMIRRLAERVGPAGILRDYYDHITREQIEACRDFEVYLDKAA